MTSLSMTARCRATVGAARKRSRRLSPISDHSAEHGAEALDDIVPGLLDAGPLERRDHAHRDLPLGKRGPDQPERARVVGHGAARCSVEFASRLVDQYQIGELDDTTLDSLQLVSSRRGQGISMNMSTISATAVSAWPAPTVSTNTTSNPAASHSRIASRKRPFS